MATRNITVVGRNPLIGVGTAPEDVWNGGGTYTGFPTGAPEAIRISSDNVNDTSAGTGARTIRITGLLTNASIDYISEDFTMNGTTDVVSTSTWYRISDAEILTAGSAGWNVGSITIQHNVTTANIFAVMAPTYNKSTLACFTIPAGRNGLLVKYTLTIVRTSGAAGSATVSIRTRDTAAGGVFTIEHVYEMSTSSPLTIDLENNSLTLVAGTDVKVTVETVSDNLTAVSALMNINYK